MMKALVSGSAGLIGSVTSELLHEAGWEVHGIDNNMRAQFFGPDGDVSWSIARLTASLKHYSHYDMDIRDRDGMMALIEGIKPELLIHCAAQPSHDLARERPFEDFDINAVGTLNLLEAARRQCPEAPFIFLSTNKVYGDAPNEKPLVELPTRWEYADPSDFEGIDESCRVDRVLHSLFGASKLAADVMVQEYGKYFGMPTVCFRGGCLTGAAHSAAELHGFLGYLAKATNRRRLYRIYGYKGKQVRDNIDARDVARACLAFYEHPSAGAVYNLGGGRENSISVIEAIRKFESLMDRRLATEYVDENRVGDHICYITNNSKFRSDYPEWTIEVGLDQILEELTRAAYETEGARSRDG
jgi:CDP-paratose 2-epimerase